MTLEALINECVLHWKYVQRERQRQRLHQRKLPKAHSNNRMKVPFELTPDDDEFDGFYCIISNRILAKGRYSRRHEVAHWIEYKRIKRVENVRRYKLLYHHINKQFPPFSALISKWPAKLGFLIFSEIIAQYYAVSGSSSNAIKCRQFFIELDIVDDFHMDVLAFAKDDVEKAVINHVFTNYRRYLNI